MVKPDASLWKRRGYGFSRVDLPECVLHACPKISGYVCSQTSGLASLKLGPLPVHLTVFRRRTIFPNPGCRTIGE